MKRFVVEFDDDTDAEIFAEAAEMGGRFDFNPLGHLTDADGWVCHYRVSDAQNLTRRGPDEEQTRG
ncbi:hypothetical protein [Amycolatopsis sp. DSM 110486]|uniref:hypothetical protein n=1 Tax=Amycolatopsis sp. DSM 110486 TaxID=2865832 RepID=UPI001C6A128C|nr:hypothetical protein [Amycolatopsis sp. DSM 110486]QYN17540.1 hypothetical protein K1T34_32665 [Amycolatopsis sp. DSM 110486]